MQQRWFNFKCNKHLSTIKGLAKFFQFERRKIFIFANINMSLLQIKKISLLLIAKLFCDFKLFEIHINVKKITFLNLDFPSLLPIIWILSLMYHKHEHYSIFNSKYLTSKVKEAQRCNRFFFQDDSKCHWIGSISNISSYFATKFSCRYFIIPIPTFLSQPQFYYISGHY